MQGHSNKRNAFLRKCPDAEKSRDFLIIGHAGGNSYMECENTLEATEAALVWTQRKGKGNISSPGIAITTTVWS